MAREFVRTTWNGTTIEGLLHRGDGSGRTVLAQTHPREWSCLTKWPGPALPDLGIDTFSFNNRYVNSTAGTELVTVFEDLARDVGAAVAYLRDRGYERIVLYGHSAGGPTMAFYQAMAEAGDEVFGRRAALSGIRRIVGDHGEPLRLPPADAVIFAASTIGTGASFLLRLDPSVVGADGGPRRDELDLFSPRNGFDPATGAGSYSQEFLHAYRAGQAARMEQLIEQASEKVGEEADRSDWGDGTEPAVLVIRGTRADPKAVDLALARHTEDEYLLEPGHRRCQIETTRLLRAGEHQANHRLPGTAVHLARTFLSYRAIRPRPGYADVATGIALDAMDYESVHSSMPGNLDHVTVPLLFLQGTSDANPQLPSAELNYRAATAATDRQLVFVEGAEHEFMATATAFGDTRAVAADVMARWIFERFPR